ncbi:2'-5'-oligoadenylate synthase 3-like isoform X1 [Haliotis rufescens]|uniref:2'-5'-oligoadenylate synthase 3-like isoform X1 n=2 Tax=Haliotis rufescens TaxID=6454 RepID=UPI00201E7C88|nr:2'-5'-oligoadenylate synthase 3-like isoform X1 [Haliotis rufescens]XP_046328856.2 2'-5'-oligoadenylate synthase 3-like isoform X1 [Haliotis rufescens]
MTTYPPGPEPLLPGMVRGQTVQEFMAGWGTSDGSETHELIDRVIRFLRNNVPISVAKIVKGGSIGRNTNFSTPSDVDIFVFCNDLGSVHGMTTQTRGLLNTIRSKLDSREWLPSAGSIGPIEYTAHSITFLLTCHDLEQQHVIHIFPLYDILKNKNVHDVYMDMRELPDDYRDCYSACLAEIQIGFIKQAPSKVHSLMRLMKYWLKMDVKTDTGYYFIETMVMHRWQRAGKPDAFNICDWFEEIMTQLADLTSLSIIWEDKYTASNYRTVPSKPVVLDPANPFRNVIPDQRCCESMMRCARTVVHRSQQLKEYKREGPAPILEGMERGQSLQQFIQYTVQPSSDDRRKCDHLVDRLTYFLQHHTRLSVNMVVRGGSLGKSTNVLGKSDVDLVVFVNNAKSLQDLATKMSILLNILQDALDSKWTEFAGYLEYVNRSDRGLQYNLSCGDNDHVHDVDILPSFNILGAKSPLEVFSEMKPMTDDERRLYAPCFSQKQVDFVKQTPIKVKNLIRLVKYWAKVEVNIEVKAVTSFFLELLVISHWMTNASPSDFVTKDWFREIMTQLTNLTSLRILWPEQYDAASFCVFRENPVVLDPTNPYINVAPRRKHHSLVMTCAQNVLYRMQAWENYRTGRYPDS